MKAIGFYEQAIQKDSNYALALVGLAKAYHSLTYGFLPPHDAYPKAREYAKRALEIDSNLADAHAVMGIISTCYDWEWESAECEFKRALELNPNSAEIHQIYSFLLSITGQHEKALTEARFAQKLDPLSGEITGMASWIIFRSGQFDEALSELLSAISFNPKQFLLHLFLGVIYRAKSMKEEAIKAHEKAVELSDETPIAMATLANTLFLFGRKTQAEKIYSILVKKSKNEYVPPMYFFWMEKLHGDMDKAFKWLEMACKEHDTNLLGYSDYQEEFLCIPNEPRFKTLLKKMGLPGN